MEKVAVDLQGLVGRGSVTEEDDAVVHTNEAVLLAMGHEDGILEGLHALGKPLLAGLQGIHEAQAVGLLVIGVLPVPVNDLGNGANATAQLVGKLDIGVHAVGCGGEEADGIADSRAGGHDAPQLLIGILGAIERDGEAAHAVAQQEYRDVRIFSDGHIHDHIGIIQDLMVAAVVGDLALGTAVSPVVEAVGAVAGLMELFRKIVVAALMLAKAMDDHDDRLIIRGGLSLGIKLGAIEGADDAFTHGDTSCIFI